MCVCARRSAHPSDLASILAAATHANKSAQHVHDTRGGVGGVGGGGRRAQLHGGVDDEVNHALSIGLDDPAAQLQQQQQHQGHKRQRDEDEGEGQHDDDDQHGGGGGGGVGGDDEGELDPDEHHKRQAMGQGMKPNNQQEQQQQHEHQQQLHHQQQQQQQHHMQQIQQHQQMQHMLQQQQMQQLQQAQQQQQLPNPLQQLLLRGPLMPDVTNAMGPVLSAPNGAPVATPLHEKMQNPHYSQLMSSWPEMLRRYAKKPQARRRGSLELSEAERWYSDIEPVSERSDRESMASDEGSSAAE